MFKPWALCLMMVFMLAEKYSAQQYHWINYSVDDGLAQTQVFGILQDNSGYLWVATIGGLSRFDGREFRNYSTRDGLLKNQVRCMEHDKGGQLWLGTDGGYSLFDGKKFKSFSLPEPYQLSQINCIVPLDNGSVLLGTDNQGILEVTDKKVTDVTDSLDGLSNLTIRTILPMSGNRLLIGTREGAFLKEKNTITPFLPDSLADKSISNIKTDRTGNIWISTFGAGAYRWDGKELKSFSSRDGLILDWVRETIHTSDGTVWFLTRKGVTEYSKGTFTQYTESNGLPFENIRTGLLDREGNFWLGTDGKGLMKFSGKAFVNFTRKDGLPDELIMSIQQDFGGRLFLGTLQSGVLIWNKDSITQLTTEHGLPNNTVWCLTRDQRGGIWMGTSLGLARYYRGTITSYGESGDEYSLPDNRVTSLFCSGDGTVWAGTREGVTSISKNHIFRHFTSENGLGAVHVRAIIEDVEGNIWLGAENGAFRYDGNVFRSFPIDPALPQGAKVFSIERDPYGSLWFGTENGLYHYNGDDAFSYVSLSSDSRADFINFLMCDSDSNLWVGTNYGIFELNLKVFHSDNQVQFRYHTYHEGIRNLECNLNAAFQDINGDCWFGTGGGLLRLNRRYLQELHNDHPPKLMLQDMLLFMQPTDWSTYTSSFDPETDIPVNLELPWNKNHLTFRFIGLSFRNPDFVKYQYKLEGFDEDWSPLAEYESATYSYLPPGEYTFKLRAVNSAGVWTESPLVYSFVILPPFWTTWWFYTLVGVGLVFLVYGIIAWRLKVLRRKQATEQLVYQSRLLELEQQSLNASMNRHFIFNALNSIQYYINRQDKLSANRYLTSFAKLIRKNLDSSTGTTMVSLEEELERLRLYLSLEHMRFQDKFTYEVEVDDEVDTEQIEVPAMLLQPFVENSIWHGVLPMERPGTIKVQLARQGDKVLIVIEDNGIGIDDSKAIKSASNHQHASKGMLITSGRIDLLRKMSKRNISLKGPFQIVDAVGKSAGTRVEIEMEVGE
jgi:ligand-binding sensor domain-containing protein/anti-sigma regulatory factor (Ser/Thr protein kinase)